MEGQSEDPGPACAVPCTVQTWKKTILIKNQMPQISKAKPHFWLSHPDNSGQCTCPPLPAAPLPPLPCPAPALKKMITSKCLFKVSCNKVAAGHVLWGYLKATPSSSPCPLPHICRRLFSTTRAHDAPLGLHTWRIWLSGNQPGI